MNLSEAPPEYRQIFDRGFASGYSMGVAVGAMAEACRSKLHDYSDIVPLSYFDNMHMIAARLNYSLVQAEKMPQVEGKPALVRVEIRRIKDDKGNATVHVKPSPMSTGKTSL